MSQKERCIRFCCGWKSCTISVRKKGILHWDPGANIIRSQQKAACIFGIFIRNGASWQKRSTSCLKEVGTMTGNEYNDKANLNHEYMIVYQDMLRYLSSKDISLLVARDIRDDILAMALESQTRGLKVEEAFGDYQKFCDAVCANAVQETRLEKLLRWWRLLSSLMVLWALLDVIGMGIDESEYVKNGMLFVSWKTIMFYIMLILGSTVLVQWHNRRSFHRILGAWYTYLIAYGVLAVGFKFVLYLLSSCFHVSTGMLSIPLWLLALLAISCILSWIAYHFLLEKQFRLYRGMQEEA